MNSRRQLFPEKSRRRKATGIAYDIVDALTVIVVWLFTVFSVLAFAALLCLAGLEFYKAMEYGLSHKSAHAGKVDKTALITAIEGLEYVFLSPLCYFLVRSISGLVFAYFQHQIPTDKVRADLVEVKSLIIGLLSSILAADLVGKAITLENNAKLDYPDCIEIAIFVVLSVYYFFLHSAAKHMRHEERPNVLEGKAKKPVALSSVTDTLQPNSLES